MRELVWWTHQEALHPYSDERVFVNVVLWDYKKREGKAQTQGGQLVDVASTTWSNCGLKILDVTRQ